MNIPLSTNSSEPQVGSRQAARPQAARPQAARPQAARPQAARPQAARHQAARHQAARPQAARHHRRPTRWGVAAVEFAVCLPVIVLLVFGSIEASSFIFLKQSLSVAAYEGAREAVRSKATNATARDRAEDILSARTVNDFQVVFPDGDVSSIERGEKVVCEVTAPTQTNSPLAGQFVTNRVLTARVVMVKE